MVLKRVVVTGLGALTPLGKTVSEYWQGLQGELMAVILLNSSTAVNLKHGLPVRLKTSIQPIIWTGRKPGKLIVLPNLH